MFGRKGAEICRIAEYFSASKCRRGKSAMSVPVIPFASGHDPFPDKFFAE
jgi:hypothetical protein